MKTKAFENDDKFVAYGKRLQKAHELLRAMMGWRVNYEVAKARVEDYFNVRIVRRSNGNSTRRK